MNHCKNKISQFLCIQNAQQNAFPWATESAQPWTPQVLDHFDQSVFYIGMLPGDQRNYDFAFLATSVSVRPPPDKTLRDHNGFYGMMFADWLCPCSEMITQISAHELSTIDLTGLSFSKGRLYRPVRRNLLPECWPYERWLVMAGNAARQRKICIGEEPATESWLLKGNENALSWDERWFLFTDPGFDCEKFEWWLFKLIRKFQREIRDHEVYRQAKYLAKASPFEIHQKLIKFTYIWQRYPDRSAELMLKLQDACRYRQCTKYEGEALFNSIIHNILVWPKVLIY